MHRTLTEADISNIITGYLDQGLSIKSICELYKISKTTCLNILGDKKRTVSRLPLTIEQKKNLSLKLKEAHASGRHPGWKFINLDKDRRSYPEKVFIDQLQFYKINERYKIEEKFPFSKYVLDFVIKDLKVNIEIDGSQHFKDSKSILHDRERDQFLIDNEWKVYRISWQEMMSNLSLVISNLDKWLSSLSNNSSRFYDTNDLIFKKTKKLKKERKLKFYVSKEELEVLINSNPVEKVANIFNVSSGTIRKRCKKLGIPIPKFPGGYWLKGKSSYKSRKFHISKAALEKMIQSKMPWEQIGKMFGVSGCTIKKRAISLGIHFEVKKQENIGKLRDITKEYLYKLRIIDKKTLKEIANILGVKSHSSIRNLEKKLGIYE
jgi:very-short-patch-repair endonuclease/transposase